MLTQRSIADGPAGFWVRLSAGLIDLLAVLAVVMLAAETFASLGVYIPIEFTVVAIYAGYTAILLAFTGQTPGKWLCGVRVVGTEDKKPVLARSVVRALLVAVSQCLLGLPFLVVALRRNKLGLHELLAGTETRLLRTNRLRRCWTMATLATLVAGCVGAHATSAWELCRTYGALASEAEVAWAQRARADEVAIDVENLESSQREVATTWLSAHGQDPAEYLVDFARRHRVTIVGEVHGVKQYLTFLSRIVADLYHRAGVRVIALECCPSVEDARLERLVTGDDFDEKLWLDIARTGPWNAWGYREHWEVLRSVWHVNKSLPSGNEPLRVVGIFPSLDLVSLGMLKRGRWQELPRVLRVMRDLPMFLAHDAHYAACVERQAFDAERRTLVWVGASHAMLCRSNQNRGPGAFRMGAMLRGRHGDEIGHVLLHSESSFPGVAKWIDERVSEVGRRQVGFDVEPSPFAAFTDSSSEYAKRGVNCRFGEATSGYLVLALLDEIERCDWWENFITARMFGLYKPFYESVCGRSLKDHREANQSMQEGVRRIYG